MTMGRSPCGFKDIGLGTGHSSNDETSQVLIWNAIALEVSCIMTCNCKEFGDGIEWFRIWNCQVLIRALRWATVSGIISTPL